jgi:hypothetical protein
VIFHRTFLIPCGSARVDARSALLDSVLRSPNRVLIHVNTEKKLSCSEESRTFCELRAPAGGSIAARLQNPLMLLDDWDKIKDKI